MKTENKAVVIGLIYAIFSGAFPIFINKGTQNVSPLFFAAITVFLGAITSFIYLLASRKLKDINKKIFPLIFLVSLFIIIIPYALMFLGTSLTSSTNTSLLILCEIIFTLIFTHFYGEKTTPLKIAGSLSIFAGAIVIIFNGSLSINFGDILIILATASYPIGNFYTKKLLNTIHPSTILFLRYLIASIFLFLLALIFENKNISIQIVKTNWAIILFTGIILLGIGKIVWFQAFKIMDISKSISLIHSSVLFSLILLVFVFKEKISVYQWAGIIIMLAGLYLTIKRPSEDKFNTKYSPALE